MPSHYQQQLLIYKNIAVFTFTTFLACYFLSSFFREEVNHNIIFFGPDIILVRISVSQCKQEYRVVAAFCSFCFVKKDKSFILSPLILAGISSGAKIFG